MFVEKPFNRFRFRYWLQPWQELDWPLLALTTGLTFFGGVMIRSTELHRNQIDWWPHWILGGIGVLLVMLIARLALRYLDSVEMDHLWIY